jgi:hemoglobin/transferrin/lactoferrin receptor protein
MCTEAAPRLAAALAAFAVSAPGLLLADDVLEEVVVVAKRRTPIQHAAATVTVIDRQHITRTLSDDVRDMVRYEPGVTVRNDPVRFGLDSFAIRGIGGDRIVAEIDGASVAESFSVGALADSGRVFTDVAFIQRVELLRGPASALYGSDAIGGVVHFQTIDPRDVLQSGRSFTSQISAGYRGDTDAWSAATLSAWSVGPAQMLLGYVRRENREADIAGGPMPNPRDSRSDQVLAKFVVPDAPGGPIEVAVEAGRVRDRTTVNALLGTPPRFTNTIAMAGNDTAEHARISIEQALPVDSAWMDDVVWRLYAQGTQTEQVTDERRRAAPPRTPPVDLHRVFALGDEAIGAELTAGTVFRTGAWAHQLVYGVEVDIGRVTEERDGYERNLNTGVVSRTILGEVFPLRDFPNTKRTEAGLYVQDEIHSEGGGWRLTPGVRFDLYRLRPREDQVYREDNPSARPVKLDERSFAPKLGASYVLSESATAFAQYARGFRLPPFEDVNIGLEIPLFNYRALPNPDLEPETSDGLELGLRTRGATWRSAVSAHYTRFEDFIESRVNLGVDPTSGVTLFQSRNLEAARIYGLELTSRLDVGGLQSALVGWSVSLSAAWARGDNMVTDQPLNSVEPLKATLMIDYDPAARWGARLAATGVAAKDRVAEAATPLYRTDSYLAFDAFAWFELGERGQINIGVTNLTDEHYIDWIDVRGRAGNDPLAAYATHPGRNASISASWTF